MQGPRVSRTAVVVVSGGDAVTPFTTPSQACSSGLAAGNTSTRIRERLLGAGHDVFTAPAMNARSVVRDAGPGSFGAFGGQPAVLPAHMTLVSNGDIDNAGEHLARFIRHLHEVEGVTDVAWVAHSNGGLFATAASRILKETGAPVRIRTMATLGTPWMGTMPLRVAYDEVPLSALGGDERAMRIVSAMAEHAHDTDLGLARENTYHYLLGPRGWLAAQAGVLAAVPVLLVAGSALAHGGGDPEIWPFDGLVAQHSALAIDVPADVIPLREARSFDVLHSIFLSDALGGPWERGMTWNDAVLDTVQEHLRTTL